MPSEIGLLFQRITSSRLTPFTNALHLIPVGGLMLVRLFLTLAFLPFSAWALTCPESLLPGGVDYVDLASDTPFISAIFSAEVAAAVEAKLRTLDIPETKLDSLKMQIRLSLTEAVQNAVEWGNGFRPGTFSRVTVTYTPGTDGAPGTLSAAVQDQGGGYDPNDTAHVMTGDDPVAHEEERVRRGIRVGGRGLMLIRQFTTQSQYDQTTKTLTLHWDLTQIDIP